MRLQFANNPEAPLFYVGNCKANTFPKHVTAEGAERKKITILSAGEGDNAKQVKTTGFLINSPKTAEYVYLEVGNRRLWVKDKSIMEGDTFTAMKIVRKKAAAADEEAQPGN